MSRPADARPLRILLASANYRPSVGGIERFVETLAETLAARGHSVTVLCCRDHDAPREERIDGYVIRRLRATQLPRRIAGVPYPVPEPAMLLHTTRSLVAHADVVHVQDAVYLTSAATLLLARRRGVPGVLTQHVGFVPQGNTALDAAQRLASKAVRRVAQTADRVVTYNDAVADWAAAEWAIPRPTLMPSGVVRPVASAAERASVRAGLGLLADEPVALFVGRDVPKKRLNVFLGAADPESMRLVAVTDRSMPSRAGTVIVPFLPGNDFRRLLASCDAFVLPSEAEGFPLALQEALLAGLPCVVTPHPGYERYLAPGDVVEVEPTSSAIRDALRIIFSDDTLRGRLSDSARAAGERSFGVDGFVDAYEGLYYELVAHD